MVIILKIELSDYRRSDHKQSDNIIGNQLKEKPVTFEKV